MTHLKSLLLLLFLVEVAMSIVTAQETPMVPAPAPAVAIDKGAASALQASAASFVGTVLVVSLVAMLKHRIL